MAYLGPENRTDFQKTLKFRVPEPLVSMNMPVLEATTMVRVRDRHFHLRLGGHIQPSLTCRHLALGQMEGRFADKLAGSLAGKLEGQLPDGMSCLVDGLEDVFDQA